MEPTLVITVHGIRTFGHWQDRFGKLVRDAHGNAIIESFRYGYFSLISFIIPPLRWMFVTRFTNELNYAAQRHPKHRIILVGHSFGTHIIAWSLHRLVSKNKCPKISTVILAGSVLRSSFPWNSLLASGTVGRVINDCGINDVVLILSQFFVLLTGMAGRIGFIGMAGTHFTNRFFRGGHSLYFEKLKSPDDEFMRTYWLPLIDPSNLVEIVDQRDAATAMRGIWLTMIQNADLLKMVAYGLIIYAIAYFGFIEPNRIAKENVERANMEFAQRQSQVAAAMLSTGVDIPAAAATLATLANFDSTTALSMRALSYWLPIFVPLPDILNGQKIVLVNWNDQNILINGEKQYIIDGPRVTAFALTDDKKRIVVQDDSDNVRLINVDDFSEIVTANLKSGRVRFSDHLKFLTNVAVSTASSQGTSINSNTDSDIDKAGPPYMDDVSPIKAYGIFESDDKSLILLYGMELESHYTDRRKSLLIAINLRDRSLSALDLDETDIRWSKHDCSELIVSRYDLSKESKGEAFYYTDFSTRKGQLFLKKLDKDEASHVARDFNLKPTRINITFPGCPGAGLSAHKTLSSPTIEGLGGTFDASMIFPMMRDEKGFWKIEAVNKQRVSHRWTVMNYKGSLLPAIPENNGEIEEAHKKLDPTNDGDEPPRSVELMQTALGQFLMYSGFETFHSSYFMVCQLAGKCLRFVLKGSDPVSVSEDGRYLAVKGEEESGIKVVDLEKFNAYTPAAVPASESALSIATAPARLFVRERDAITVYNIDHGLSSARRIRVHAGAGSLGDFGVVGHIVIARLGENGLEAFDETGQRLWASAGDGLRLSRAAHDVLKFSGSIKDDVVVVFSSEEVRLLNLSTGFPLTRVFSIRDLPVIKDNNEKSDEVILNARLRNDGRVEIVTSERIVVRDAPISAEAVSRARSLGFENWLGAEASEKVALLSNRLPLSGPAAQDGRYRFANNPK